MERMSISIGLVGIFVFSFAVTARVVAQEEERPAQGDTSRPVIINNYYYGGYGYPMYPYYPAYPRYGYYYPRAFLGFSVGVPVHPRPFFHRRFHHFRGHGFVRSFGHVRNPAMGSRSGRGRY